ncbi:SHOCT domain-containing protein [Priestia megaterium]|uniref:SHOCT domain-containing protein n=1 Tax=Priestia megaterium TaxID=1404 RepID=UPI002E2373F2|nr:SHOCT domain-containing protein [Priestia megaterium]MED4275279.1 SHOCT domain-containing protein [Priestia megaterium]MED4315409.1 SHOCT domain-containing protein [Priestia megaterium]
MNVEKLFINPFTWFLLFIGFFIITLVLGMDSDWSLLTCLLSLASVGMAVAMNFREKELNTNNIIDKIETRFMQVEDFETDRYYISEDYNSLIGIDEQNQKICFLENVGNRIDKFRGTYKDYKYDSKIYEFKDLLEAEILQDGEMITKTSRGSQIGGALIGGVLAGGVGAIIGGLSGSTTSDSEFNKIALKVLMNDTQNPVKLIYFLDEIAGVKKYEDKYKKANSDSMDWHGLLRVIIQKVDKEDRIQSEECREPTTAQPGNLSVADELKKLSDLHKEGILSEEEFNEHKKKILSV